MDPSEFEGTVERSQEAVDAGALEHLLQESGPKFVMVDMTKDIGDLHLSIYSLQESMTKYGDVSISNICKDLDSVALKLTELKEDYVMSRKLLTQQVKKYTTEHLSSSSDDPFIKESKEIIAQFKKEFDRLATLAKFSESAFIDIYKTIRELPDPVVIATDGLNVCLKTNEMLSKAQEQLSIANDIINVASDSPSGSNTNSQLIKQVELDRLHGRYEAEVEELKQSYLNDIDNLRSKYENDMRAKERSLTEVFEKQQLELQEQLDAVIAKKDVEISSLLRSLSENQVKNQELDERSRLLDAEMARRRELEEKWRSAVITISDMTGAAQEMSNNLEIALKEGRGLRNELESSSAVAEKQQALANRQIEALNEKITELTAQLESRPPVDLSALIASVSSIGGGFSSNRVGKGSESITWHLFEKHLLDAIRKNDTDATQSRIKAQEYSKQLSDLQAQCTSLKSQLSTQTSLTASLERDLQHAYEAVQASGKHSKATSSSNAFNTIRATSSDAQLESLMSTKRINSEDLSGYANDLEIGLHSRAASSSPTPAVVGSVGIGDDSSYNVNERILQAVQSQRDRYMRASKEKDGELVELKAKLDRASDDQLQLRNENLELYRRLRALRVSSGGGRGGGVGSVGGGGSGILKGGGGGGFADHNTRSRRVPSVDASADDAFMDEKYLSLYEAEISPFKVEELDRQHMMSRLNIFERGLAYINRHILQDRWARHALMVYLALVHFLALIYISKVLNPELIEEMDAHMKAKWSSETFSMPEHPDI